MFTLEFGNTTEVGNSDLKNVSVVEPGESCLGVIDVFSSNAMNGNYELFTGSAQQQLSIMEDPFIVLSGADQETQTCQHHLLYAVQ